jgi:hypothetical protein
LSSRIKNPDARLVAIGMTRAAAELASPFAAKDSSSVVPADVAYHAIGIAAELEGRPAIA